MIKLLPDYYTMCDKVQSRVVIRHGIKVHLRAQGKTQEEKKQNLGFLRTDMWALMQ